MKRQAFEDFLAAKALPDEWWVSVGNEVLERPMTLDAVAELEYEMPGREIALMHPVSVEDPSSEWVPFEFEGMQKLSKAIGKENSGTDDTLAIHLKIEMIAEEISEMRLAINELRQCYRDIEGTLNDALAIDEKKRELAERQRFIEEGEEVLLRKTISHEEDLATYEQQQEDAQRARSA